MAPAPNKKATQGSRPSCEPPGNAARRTLLEEFGRNGNAVLRPSGVGGPPVPTPPALEPEAESGGQSEESAAEEKAVVGRLSPSAEPAAASNAGKNAL